ncbi:PAS domain S-box protein [Pontibacter sp. E15-1]|nr:PAS domain S-box protein [Pontibacter sp. E15-1]
MFDEKGIYTYLGNSVKAQLGYEVEELLGTAALACVHPDDLAYMTEAFALLRQVPNAQLRRFRLQEKSGEWRWMQGMLTNLLQDQNVEGVLMVLQDVTALVEAETSKAHYQAYFESLFFGHPEAVFALDGLGAFTEVNSQVAELTGYTREETLGGHYHRFVHPDFIQHADEMFRQALAGHAQHTELSIISKQGQLKLLFITLVPVYAEGKAVGIQGIAQDITLAKKSQQLLNEQTTQLNNIVESIPDPFFVVDDAWRFEYVNTAFASFLGKPRTETVGKSILALHPSIEDTLFFEKCQEVAAHRTTVNFEESYPSSKFETIRYSIFPIKNGIAVHFEDFTAQKAILQELEKLSLVASKTTNGVVIMDAQCRIEWVNDGFCRLTGYTRAEVAGKVPSVLLQGPESDPAASRRIREKYESQQPFSEEILNYRKSGEKFWFAIDVTPIFDAQGQLTNYIAIETDITEKKDSEAKLTKLASDLLRQNLNLQQFAYMVSHNLRAPVANIIGLTSLLKKFDMRTAPYDKSLEKLEYSGHQLDTVIRDISTILTVREAVGVCQPEPVNLLALCREVLAPFEEQLQECKTELKLEVESRFEVLSIKAYLYSILYNLISNAIKFRANERPLLIRLGIAWGMHSYVLTFSDNGLGMDLHQAEDQLFKLYTRFHPDIPGKGIGLYLVKTQVEALGGKISVSSAPGIGTTFTISLGEEHV